MNTYNDKKQTGIIYDETQRLPRIWFFSSLTITVLILMYFGLGQYLLKNNWFYNSLSIEARGFIVLASVLIFINILFSHLRIIIRSSGLNVSYWPFLHREVKFSEIVGFELVRYRPGIEPGAWGLRTKEEDDISFNINGTQGIRLFLKNGHTLLLGSQMVDEMLEAIKNGTGKQEGINLFYHRKVLAI